MRSNIRKIGNSRGILILASFLAACEITDEIELRLDGRRIVIEPIRSLRSGWFEGYIADAVDDAWDELVDTDAETEDWVW